MGVDDKKIYFADFPLPLMSGEGGEAVGRRWGGGITY